MSSYLDIYSAYRNRNIWPNPGEFEVLVSSSGRKSSAIADDPVALSSPIHAWTGSLFNTLNLGTANIQGVITFIGVGNSTSNQNIVFSCPPNTLQQTENYYSHATWRSITTPNEYAKITSYKYLGNDRGQITLDNRLL